jgi:hypothetical protein
MKKLLLIAAALAGVVLTGTAFAYAPQETAVPTRAVTPKVIPSSVVNPTGLPLSAAGATIEIEFTLNQLGQPQQIKLLRVDDAVLRRSLLAAFSQWRFEPVGVDAAQKRFILPVQIRPEA